MTPEDSGMTPEALRPWRKERRAELIARRSGTPGAQRAQWNSLITEHLLGGFDIPGESIVGFCWPFKGEFDARFAVKHWRDHGALAALPEVVRNKAPLQFRLWRPGVAMRAGVYDIPVPDGTEIVEPDIAVVPMNGFDARGYRLGYGGGFFDRTLASLERRVVAIGVAYEILRMETIHPQQYDVPMDFVVTEAGIYAAGAERLEKVDEASARQRVSRLLAARRLPRSAYREGYSSPVCYAQDFPGYFGEK
jgi:5-formyltetrahydrofolate cyclo-ligase